MLLIIESGLIHVGVRENSCDLMVTGNTLHHRHNVITAMNTTQLEEAG